MFGANLFAPGTVDAQPVSSPDGNVNQSDYKADDDASTCSSISYGEIDISETGDSEHGDPCHMSIGRGLFQSASTATPTINSSFSVFYRTGFGEPGLDLGLSQTRRS